MPIINPSISGGKSLDGYKIAGLSIGTLFGAVITWSIFSTNRLNSQYLRNAILKQKSQGFDSETFVDKMFGEIQNAALQKQST